jgi:flavin-dependent dehydrogenase
VYGITFSSPNGTQVHFDVEDRAKPAPGYCHKRMIFDNFLYQNAAKTKGVDAKTVTITEIVVENGTVVGVKGTTESGQAVEYRASLVLGADGATSVLARTFGLNKNPPEHFIAALRAYYSNVDGLTDRIEIHMVDKLIPGYFWIFPLPNNEANVGLGMITKDMNEKKVSLKDAMLKEIADNPLFKERFSKAKLEGDIKGWNLPVASYHRKCYGNGFMLLGDAASLIDPLSGEGVGTAMISGKVSAQVAIEALAKGDYSEKFLKEYDKRLWAEIGEEIDADYKVQKLSKQFPFLIDKLMIKASKDEKFRKKVEAMLPTVEGRKKFGLQEFISLLT